MDKKSIFEKTHHLDPTYQYLEKYVHYMYKGFWTPSKYEKLIREVDAPYYFNQMSDLDKDVIKKCILAIALVEDKVKLYWATLPLDIPQTIVGDIGGVFTQSEVTHRRSYSSLAESLKVNTDNLSEYKALRDRIAYLNKYSEVDPKIIGKKRILKKLVLFTSLVERCSLFTQFYILMSYEKASRGLKTISSLQTSTASEEIIHYSFGIDLINIIKEESPQLWDEYLIELVEKNIKEAYKAELKLINWFFEKGVPNHLTKEEVINFLNKNFTTVVNDLGLNSTFKVDENLYMNKNVWFDVKLKSSEPDFFDNPVGGYSSEKQEINIDTFQF